MALVAAAFSVAAPASAQFVVIDPSTETTATLQARAAGGVLKTYLRQNYAYTQRHRMPFVAVRSDAKAMCRYWLDLMVREMVRSSPRDRAITASCKKLMEEPYVSDDDDVVLFSAASADEDIVPLPN